MERDFEFDRIEQLYIEKMGQELGWLFTRFWQDSCWLHVKWQEYEALYGKSEARIELLNATAPEFFRIAEDAIWRDIILHLCRLTDKKSIGGHETLTLKRLPEYLDCAIKAKVERLLDELDSATKFARMLRDKLFAHSDLAPIQNPTVHALPPAGMKDVRDAIEAADSVLQTVSLHYTNYQESFDVVTLGGGADSLVYFLREGQRAEQARRTRIADGRYLPEDLGPPDPI